MMELNNVSQGGSSRGGRQRKKGQILGSVYILKSRSVGQAAVILGGAIST